MTDRAALAGRLLAVYRLWAVASILAFILFIFTLSSYYLSEQAHLLFLFVILLTGFLCIGTISLSRHALVRLKVFIGREVGMVEFISTQFVFFLFPFTYVRLKKEVAEFREAVSTDQGD